MKFRFVGTALHDGRVVEFGRWTGDQLSFGNPEKNRPGFQPRWVSEGFLMPRDSIGSLKPHGDDELLVTTEDKPWVVPRLGHVGRVSTGELIVANDGGYQGLVRTRRLVPIYDPKFYEDRMTYWDRCERKVAYAVP